MIFLLPERDWGTVVATNIAGERANDTLREVAGEIYRRFK